VTPDRELWISRFNEHNAKVRASIPSSQLLVVDITEGNTWQSLCPFLARTDGPCASPLTSAFPHENT
jgi:uncharacterized protein YqjF (DUF2071 family)